LRRTIRAGDREVAEYYHRGVVAHLVGYDLAPSLDVEMIRPGEGEVKAAERLLERLVGPYGRFFDAVLGDALYAEAPFINCCLEHGKHVVVVLKGDERLLLQDARGLFSSMPPVVWTEPGGEIRAWDAEGFTSFEGVPVPLRVLRTEESFARRQRIAGAWVEKTEKHEWCWATTIPIAQLPTRTLCHVGHRRWDIENDLFNVLSSHRSLDHCFKHDPTAILNFILTLFIAFVLLQSFHQRNLKPPRRAHLALIALRDELYLALALPAGSARRRDAL
jgi:hypothetical protein